MKSIFNVIETYHSQSGVSWDMRFGVNINYAASDSVWNTYVSMELFTEPPLSGDTGSRTYAMSI
jgi:hypothetical protein